MFYILSYQRNGIATALETFDLDEVSRLIDDLVLNEVNFTLVAICNKVG